MLNPSQKNLYKDVMQETLRNLASIGSSLEHHIIENIYRNSWKKLSGQVVEGLYDCKDDHQCAEIFDFTTHSIVNQNSLPGVYICENSGCATVVIGHLSLSVLLKPDPKHESCEDQEYGKELYNMEYGAPSSSLTSFENYESTYTVERIYKTERCDEDYRYGQNVEKTFTEEKPFECKQCGKCFSSSRYFRRHERRHRAKKCYICKQCGKAFAFPTYLQTHERIHTGEKPYVCLQCGKTFAHSRSLKTHKRTHSVRDLFVCNYCGKTLRHYSSLQIHTRIHTGEKPYVCKPCGKAFITYRSFRIHERIHTGETP